MLRYRHIHHFAPAVLAVNGFVCQQSVKLHPRESVVYTAGVWPHRRLYAEVTLCLGRKLLVGDVSDYHRLAVPHIPQLGKARIFCIERLIGIYLFINGVYRPTGGGVGVKCDLGNIHALFKIFIPHRYKLLYPVGVGHGVGRVKNDKIYACVCQHLKMLAHHPGVL